MKNIIIILIITFSFQFVKAQKFIKTNKYTIVNKIGTKQQEYTALLDIVTADNNATKIGTIHVSDLDTFDNINIRVLSNPTLEDVNEVIRIDTNYSACCGHTDTYYFMVTDENDFISLPKIENTYCDETISEIQYIFPGQTFGKENMILKTKVTYTEDIRKVKSTELLQSLVWNDDLFNNSEPITYLDTDKN